MVQNARPPFPSPLAFHHFLKASFELSPDLFPKSLPTFNFFKAFSFFIIYFYSCQKADEFFFGYILCSRKIDEKGFVLRFKNLHLFTVGFGIDIEKKKDSIFDGSF